MDLLININILTAMIALEWCFKIEEELKVVTPIFKEYKSNSYLASMNFLTIPLVSILIESLLT